MTQDLTEKVAIVTGGARGIGAEIAAKLSHRGAVVVMADIDEAQLNAVAAQLPGPSTIVARDLTAPEAGDALVQKLSMSTHVWTSSSTMLDTPGTAPSTR